MSIPSGAIAYRASSSNAVEEQIDHWETAHDNDRETNSKEVLCPKCGEPYILVEGIEATGEILQDDMEFLAKALSSGHPAHPARMVIRDSDALLNRHVNLQFMAVRKRANEEAASIEVPTQSRELPLRPAFRDS